MEIHRDIYECSIVGHEGLDECTTSSTLLVVLLH